MLKSLSSLLAAALVILVPAGGASGAEALTGQPLAAPSTGEGTTLFHKLTPEKSGVDFVNPIDKAHELKRLYLGPFASGGIALGDVDGDGVPDLFLTTGPRRNRLYRGLGGMKFEDITGKAGVAGGTEWSAGATMVDIDGDGDLDIYVCNYDAPNALFINDGGGVFSEKAKEFGLAIVDASLIASFCDYDLDGDLDCFVLTCDYKSPGGRPTERHVVKVGDRYEVRPEFEKYFEIAPDGPGRVICVNAGREDYLFRNDGEAGFTNVTKEAGIAGRGRGNSATWWDYDGDGLPDLYVGNDFKDPDRLYRNKGDGTFADVIRQVAPHTPWYSMGADVADLDGDGREDLLIADMAGTTHYKSKVTMGQMGDSREFLLTAVPRQYMHNVLYLNNGVGRLADVAYQAGLSSSDWTWAVKLEDFDCDGWVDVFFSNGVARSFNDSDVQRTPEDLIEKPEWDFYESQPARPEENFAFRNEGDLQFTKAGKAWGLDDVEMTYAAATGDLDGDGDQDLVVTNLDAPVFIYRNDAPPAANRLRVRLAGAGANAFGLGAKVTLEAGGRKHTRTLVSATGFLSSNLPELCFGLGESGRVEKLTVDWARGHRQEFTDVAANQRLVIAEPTEAPPGVRAPVRKPPLFAEVASPSLREIIHKETPFDDYVRQPLLPYQHSMLGPGLAWADVDADGDVDFYLGRAKGEAGRIVFNEGRGNFREGDPEGFAAHAASEDLGALFLDVDRDGDPDLYVVSGSVECEPGDPSLRDRLYLNDGAGNFTSAPEGTLPDRRDSGSCVVAADFDRDGDLDLFVGGRVVPGAWPETPSSALLRNDGELGKPKFTDITGEMPVLEKVGLVTAALWSDVDGDGWIDLLVACEWGPVRLFLNREGTLVEATEAAGLAKHLGWWSGLAGADLDGDGDIDYVATNAGWNVPYHPKPEKPELLYYGDLDGSGGKNIVEAKFEGEICYPRRGYSCSSAAMPILKDKIGSFHNFAVASLAQLYDEERLSRAQKLEANLLSHCVLLNDGKGRFEVHPLPWQAQISPSHGLALADVNADGRPDCVLGQNFFGAQPEVGLYDAGLGLVLLGNGDGTFTPMEPGESGIIVPGATTAVTLADVNGDERPEIVFATNRGRVQIFSEPGAAAAETRFLAVRLSGKPGNPSAVGAKVTVTAPGIAKPQTAEVTAGSGSLGASEATLWFGLGKIDPAEKVAVEVRWPDGRSTRGEASAASRSIYLREGG